MKIYGVTVLFLLGIVMPAFARKPETGFLDRTLKFGNATYRYQVFVPSSFDRRKPWPVILFLHGRGESGSDGLAQTGIGIGNAIRSTGGAMQFIVVMPQCPNEKSWTDPDISEMAVAALDSTVREFHGDRQRIYLTGMSMGGYGTWQIAAAHPGKFAALVPICGGLRHPKDLPEIQSPLVGDAKIADPYEETAKRIAMVPVPVWIFHGAMDSVVPVEESRKMAAALRAARVPVKYTEYPDTDHNAWDKAYAEPGLFSWMLEQIAPDLRNSGK